MAKYIATVTKIAESNDIYGFEGMSELLEKIGAKNIEQVYQSDSNGNSWVDTALFDYEQTTPSDIEGKLNQVFGFDDAFWNILNVETVDESKPLQHQDIYTDIDDFNHYNPDLIDYDEEDEEEDDVEESIVYEAKPDMRRYMDIVEGKAFEQIKGITNTVEKGGMTAYKLVQKMLEMRNIMNACENKQLNEGIWSLPSTPGKARELAKIMDSPLTIKTAGDRLYHLFGDDALFDEINSYDNDDDIRHVVSSHLQKTIKHYMEQPEDFEEEFDKVTLGLLSAIIRKHMI